MAFTTILERSRPQFSSCLFLTTSLPITKSENHHVHIAIDGFGRTNHTCLLSRMLAVLCSSVRIEVASFCLNFFHFSFFAFAFFLTNQLILGLSYPSPLGSSNGTHSSAPTTCYGTLDVITNTEYGCDRMAAATRRGSKA